MSQELCISNRRDCSLQPSIKEFCSCGRKAYIKKEAFLARNCFKRISPKNEFIQRGSHICSYCIFNLKRDICLECKKNNVVLMYKIMSDEKEVYFSSELLCYNDVDDVQYICINKKFVEYKKHNKIENHKKMCSYCSLEACNTSEIRLLNKEDIVVTNFCGKFCCEKFLWIILNSN